MTTLKLKTVIALMFTLMTFAVVKAQDDDQPIKINTYLVNIPVIASDRDGHYIAGLKKEDFTITQNGVKQDIEFFAGDEAPMNVAILIDTSGSTVSIMGDIKKAARTFLDVLQPEDKAMVVSFDGQFKILCELTGNRKDLRKAIDKAQLIEVQGTSMYNAIYEVVKNKLGAIKGRKALILLTDGMEGSFNITIQQLMYLLSESDTIVYPIHYNKDFFKRPQAINYKQLPKPKADEIRNKNEEAAKRFVGYLQSMAEATAGRVFVSDETNFKESFQSIADELKKQYLLGFYPQSVDEGKIQQFAVGVNQKNIVLRTKKRIRMKLSAPENKSNAIMKYRFHRENFFKIGKIRSKIRFI